MYLWRARRRLYPVLRATWCAIRALDRAGAAPTLSVELLAPLGPHHHHRALAHRRPYRSLDLGLRLDLAGRHSFQAGRRCHFFRAGRRRRCNSQRGYLRQCRSAFWEGCPAGDPRTAQHVPHAARAFGPGAPNPRATTDGGQHFFQAGKRCHSLRAGGRRLCNTTGLNFATTGIPGLPSTCCTQHVPSAQVLLTPVLRPTAGSTSSRQEEGVTPSKREEGVYVTPVVTGWPPLRSWQLPRSSYREIATTGRGLLCGVHTPSYSARTRACSPSQSEDCFPLCLPPSVVQSSFSSAISSRLVL